MADAQSALLSLKAERVSNNVRAAFQPDAARFGSLPQPSSDMWTEGSGLPVCSVGSMLLSKNDIHPIQQSQLPSCVFGLQVCSRLAAFPLILCF